jgi:hypothetical protein
MDIHEYRKTKSHNYRWQLVKIHRSIWYFHQKINQKITTALQQLKMIKPARLSAWLWWNNTNKEGLVRQTVPGCRPPSIFLFCPGATEPTNGLPYIKMMSKYQTEQYKKSISNTTYADLIFLQIIY